MVVLRAVAILWSEVRVLILPFSIAEMWPMLMPVASAISRSLSFWRVRWCLMLVPIAAVSWLSALRCLGSFTFPSHFWVW